MALVEARQLVEETVVVEVETAGVAQSEVHGQNDTVTISSKQVAACLRVQ
jgi:hypothetical protein